MQVARMQDEMKRQTDRPSPLFHAETLKPAYLFPLNQIQEYSPRTRRVEEQLK